MYAFLKLFTYCVGINYIKVLKCIFHTLYIILVVSHLRIVTRKVSRGNNKTFFLKTKQ